MRTVLKYGTRNLVALACAATLAAIAPTAEAESCLKGYRTKDYQQVLVVNRCRHQIFASIIERNPTTMELQCAIFQFPQKDYGRAYAWADYVVAEPPRSSISEREAMMYCTMTGYPIVTDSNGKFVLIMRN